ncbi:MAG: hypothetical protein IPL46_08425 [Saprospiraceae bacterium]|nr:hypothetical protein [Saprospiraceae bacterium]
MNRLIRNIMYHLGNLPGFHTSRKIITLTSDDWGSIRMPSKEIYDRLISKGLALSRCPYSRVDNLATGEDLTCLYEVLDSVKDINGMGAVMTANTIVANPDFDKIEASDFQRYYFEPFTETLANYPNHHGSFDLWKQGIAAGLFVPQYHGREHVNVRRWMAMLRSGSKEMRSAFGEGVCGLSNAVIPEGKNVMAAFDIDSKDEQQEKIEILKSGHHLFRQIFGFTSQSFIAPTYVWNSDVELSLTDMGIKLIQSNPYQKMPVPGRGGFRKIYHYNGQRNKYGQSYIVRNAYFEPTITNGKLSAKECMERIEIAFRCGKPAVISTHRLNFIGSIDVQNRDHNLNLFSSLLKGIVHRWSDVEFMSVSQLGALINESVDVGTT